MSYGLVIDASTHPLPGPARLAAHVPPVTGVISYVSSPGGVDKDWRAAEIEAYRHAGVDVGIVFEDAAERSRDGYAAGARDAQMALSRVAALGLDPADGPCFASHDWDTRPGGLTQAVQYQQGWNLYWRAPHRAAYGGRELIRALFDMRLIDYGWQTSAWSDGVWDSRAQLRQSGTALIAGVQCDLDRPQTVDWGQWRWGEVSQAEVEAGVRAVFRLPAGISFDVPHGQADNRGVFANLVGMAQNNYNSVGSILSVLGSIRQALGPMADRDAAVLAAIAALPTRLSSEDVAALADQLALDVSAVTVAVTHAPAPAPAGTST